MMKLRMIYTVLACYALAFTPFASAAVDCDDAFSAMPDHSKDNSAENKAVQSASGDCEKKFPPKGEDPKKTDDCVTAAFTDLANKGNFIAAEELAYNACHNNNMSEAKKWLDAVAKSSKASKEDKDKAAEVSKKLG
jgi:hypothetical protein